MNGRLSRVHTRRLLVWLACARRFGGRYDPTAGGDGPFCSIAEIKQELATRPHVKRGKALRRALKRAHAA